MSEEIETNDNSNQALDTSVTQKMLNRMKSNMNLLLATGRPRTYTAEQLFMLANEYFEETIQNPIQSNQLLTGGQKAGIVQAVNKPRIFTLERLCLYLGMSTNYFFDMEQSLKDKKDSESIQLSSVIAYIRQVIRTQRIELASSNELNPMFVAKLEGLSDKVEHTGEIKNTVTQINFVQRSVEDTTYIEVQDIIEGL